VGGRVAVTTAAGREIRACRILLATGLTDVLPDLPGVRENWGDRVIHCPWCHGWEVRDQRIAVIDTAGAGAHQATLFTRLSDDVTLVCDREVDLDAVSRERLGLVGVKVHERAATSIDAIGDGMRVTFTDGATLEVDAVVVGPRFAANAAPVDHLVTVGEHASGMGTHVVVDEMGSTTHPAIYAAGNVADPMQQVVHAAANGSRVAMSIAADLMEDDIDRARRSVAETEEWDGRYREHEGEMWSGQPNGSLVVELADARPGTALDLGCGEGADAIWLASLGWDVTGTDISNIAVDRARDAAAKQGVAVTFAASDVITEPLPAATYDLIAISYPALKRDPGIAAMPNIVGALTPGGRLVVIGHTEMDMAVAAEHGFDPGQYLSIDDMIDAVGRLGGGDDGGEAFTIETDEVRDRPNPPPNSHHSRDRILTIRRR
ncbi:FAD-dependent oxidoreductase, partial [Ilumatobacter sp.]|uniref:FAD-dependent oxidoreductase n=1 Tax=Ilumatobacter sp. TaxID=1967498 RepID=UPI003C4EA77D